MHLKNKIVNGGKILLLLLFLGYYSGITLFYHGHLVNGQIIVHSHPFCSKGEKKANFPLHTHNTAAYFLIQQLSETNWDNTSNTPQLPKPIVIVCAPLLSYEEPFILSIQSTHISLRAPPVAC
jgi:hypothetical protein